MTIRGVPARVLAATTWAATSVSRPCRRAPAVAWTRPRPGTSRLRRRSARLAAGAVRVGGAGDLLVEEGDHRGAERGVDAAEVADEAVGAEALGDDGHEGQLAADLGHDRAAGVAEALLGAVGTGAEHDLVVLEQQVLGEGHVDLVRGERRGEGRRG